MPLNAEQKFRLRAHKALVAGKVARARTKVNKQILKEIYEDEVEQTTKGDHKRKPAASHQTWRRITGKSEIQIVKKERSGDTPEAGVQQTSASSHHPCSAWLGMCDLRSWLGEQDGDVGSELWESLPLSVITALKECGYKSTYGFRHGGSLM